MPCTGKLRCWPTRLQIPLGNRTRVPLPLAFSWSRDERASYATFCSHLLLPFCSHVTPKQGENESKNDASADNVELRAAACFSYEIRGLPDMCHLALITQRSSVQIRPPQPRRDEGLAVASAEVLFANGLSRGRAAPAGWL
jgi:hypothetical protein